MYKRSLGPSLDQLFTQSNFGIVTKLGIWLMPQPECYMPLRLRVWQEDDLGPLVDTLRLLMLDRTIENVPQIWNTIAHASVLSTRAPWYQGEGPIPDEVIDRIGEVYEELCVETPWQKGDLIALDNMLVAHARRPFTGERKIVVAMGGLVSKEQVVTD